MICCLPLRLRPINKLFQDRYDLLERSKVGLKLFLNLVGVLAELGVEVLTVGNGGHSGAEDGLDHEAVVGLQGVAVGSAERVSKLLLLLGDVVLKTLAGEVKASAILLAVDVYRQRGNPYRTSQRQPSVAVCLPVLSSLRTRSWTVPDSAGAAAWRARSFCR